jgi:hypothetical protein
VYTAIPLAFFPEARRRQFGLVWLIKLYPQTQTLIVTVSIAISD